MPAKSHALNLFSPDETKKFRILPESTKTVLSGDGCLIEIDTSLKLPTHANVGASLAVVETGLAAAQADLLTNSATAASASNTVAVALNTYKSANDAALLVEKQRVDAILAGASVDLDQLAEIVAAYEAADTSITSAVTSNASGLASLTAQFNLLLARVDELTSE